MNIRTLYTIGHSNYSLGQFMGLLRMNGITAVADVRSHPSSRHVPHFNRESLQRYLKQNGVQYVFMGKELGARWDKSNLYGSDGRVDFKMVAKESLFKEGIARVLQGAEKYRLALMCSEKNPLDCHRTHLIAHHLAREQGVIVMHILEQGETVEHVDLLLSHSKPQSDLFRNDADVVTETMGAKVAYRKPSVH